MNFGFVIGWKFVLFIMIGYIGKEFYLGREI